MQEKKRRRQFWSTVFTLTGTVIGAGILGLPYVFAQSGFLIGVFWLVALGLIMTYVNLCIAETTLRTKKIHHLPGLAERYLGKWGKRLMFFSVAFGIYSALVAYLIGEGQSFSQLFFGNLNYHLFFGFLFWIVMTFLLRDGLRGLKKVEMYGVFGIITIIFILFVLFFPQFSAQNVNYVHFNLLFFPFGVTLFSLLGFSAIPELRREIRGSEHLFHRAIMLGVGISVVLYIIFTLTFVGVLGVSVPEVATLAFGNIVTLLGIFTMFTSYFVLSFALQDIFTYDFKESPLFKFLLVSLTPLLIYFMISFFHWDNFVTVLGVGGVISGGLTAILALIMNLKSKKLLLKGRRKPEFVVPINWFIIGFLSLLFLFGVVVEVFW